MTKSPIWSEFKWRSRHLAYSVASGLLAFVFGRVTRRYVMGFGPQKIEPGSTATIQAQPQVLFRGSKIVNTGDVEGLFIQGLFVGCKPQLPTFQNAIAVKFFGPEVLDNEMSLDICDPALFITWQIHNTSDTAKYFSASISGEIVDIPFYHLLMQR